MTRKKYDGVRFLYWEGLAGTIVPKLNIINWSNHKLDILRQHYIDNK